MTGPAACRAAGFHGPHAPHGGPASAGKMAGMPRYQDAIRPPKKPARPPGPASGGARFPDRPA